MTKATAHVPRGGSRTPIVVLLTAFVLGCAVAVALAIALNAVAPTDPEWACDYEMRATTTGVAFVVSILGLIIGAKISLGGWPRGTSGIQPEEWWTQTGRRVSRFVVGLAIVVFFVPVLVAASLL
jgi:hypothetical protein